MFELCLANARLTSTWMKAQARHLCAAVKQGVDEDDIVAMQLGAQDVSQLTERQQAYIDKIKSKLAQVRQIRVF